MKNYFAIICIATSVMFTSFSFAQIAVENSASIGFGLLGGGTQVMQETYTISNFDMGAGSKLVVAFGTEAGTPDSFSVDFGGAELTQISFATDGSGGERVSVFFLDDASGVADVNVNLSMLLETPSNGPGIYVASLSGAQPGFEAAGTFCDGENHFNGDEFAVPPRTTIETIVGTSAGAYVVAVFADQGHPADIIPFGPQFSEVGMFNGDNGNVIGSAVTSVAEGFGTGDDLEIGFNDGSPLTTPFENTFQARSVIAWGSFAADSAVLLGDVNLDREVNLLDVGPFVALVSNNGFQAEADINQDGSVDLLDIAPFVELLLNP